MARALLPFLVLFVLVHVAGLGFGWRLWPPELPVALAGILLVARAVSLLRPSMRRPLLRFMGAAALLAWVWWAPFSVQGMANLAMYYALVALSLVVLTGWVGQISLAQASFVGVGAFSTALVVNNWSVPFPLTFPLIGALSAGVAALLGVVALRVRGLYLAVATLIFAWVVSEFFFNQSWLAGVGGAASTSIEPLGEEGAWPFFDLGERTTYYYVMLAALAGSLAAMANLRDSKTGRAWSALNGSEVAAASFGIAVTRYKLLAFASAGFLAGVAGSLDMTHQEVASASTYSVDQSLFFLAIAVVGGIGRLGGAVAGGVVFAGLGELFFRVQALNGLLLVTSAALLAIVLLFFPQGLAGIPSRVAPVLSRVWAGSPGASMRRLGRAVENGVWEVFTWKCRVVRASATTAADSNSGQDSPASMEMVNADGTPVDGAAVDWDTEWASLDDPTMELEFDSVEEPARPDEQVEGSASRKKKRRRQRRKRVETPDALSAALEAPQKEPDEPQEVGPPSGLVYVPGTATKVDLPPRQDLPMVLSAIDITVKFGGVVAAAKVNIEVRQGEIVGLIGPNGAGKTTTFNAISGLNQPTSGTVVLNGEDVTDLDVHERAALGMSRTFQAIQLFSDMTVFDNLMVATHLRNPSRFASHMFATNRSLYLEHEARRRVSQVIRLTGLEDEADRLIAGLSFGRRRLVELARALVTGAPFVMLDEPASGLDNAETERFSDLLLWVRQSLGVTLLLIEHDVKMVTSLSDYMYVINQGKPIADGTPVEVQRNQAVIDAYLGQAGADSTPTAPLPPPTRASANGGPDETLIMDAESEYADVGAEEV